MRNKDIVVHYEQNIIQPLKGLINLQKEYIKFLGEEVEKLSVIKHYSCTLEVFEKGEDFRERLDILYEALERAENEKL